MTKIISIPGASAEDIEKFKKELANTKPEGIVVTGFEIVVTEY